LPTPTLRAILPGAARVLPGGELSPAELAEFWTFGHPQNMSGAPQAVKYRPGGLDRFRPVGYRRAMSQADADYLYMRLQQHHQTCPVCTDAQDCAEGHRLLMQWGQAESGGKWWRDDLERAAARGITSPEQAP